MRITELVFELQALKGKFKDVFSRSNCCCGNLETVASLHNTVNSLFSTPHNYKHFVIKELKLHPRTKLARNGWK